MRTTDAQSAARRLPGAPALRPHGTPTRTARLAGGISLAGLALYVIFAPHSIAGAWIGLSVAILGWLTHTIITRRVWLRRTPLDLPLWLFFAWSVVSALMSTEPGVSVAKLGSVSAFLVFYLTQSVVTPRHAVWLALLLIASGVTGVLWSVSEVARGRGVCVEAVADDSPLRRAARELRPGDCVWRVNRRRVSSVLEIDAAIRDARTGTPLALSVITRGEHVEWAGPLVTDAMKSAASPAGLIGAGPTRRFRASGWTRHYETFAECLQIIAQLALGFALAYFQRRATTQDHERTWRWRVALLALAFMLLAAGIALTAMRTTLVAFAIGALVVAWRAAAAGDAKSARAAVVLVILLALSFGALAVWRTRAEGALSLQDASSRLRVRVARVALARIPVRPIFGHGMDAMHRHWHEWGFPGDDMIHTHSTPLQIAFDRGLPALALWLWLIAAAWFHSTRAEKAWRASGDARTHGLLLGATGALAGFATSSLVNYNFGDAEVALILWWLLGAVTVAGALRAPQAAHNG